MTITTTQSVVTAAGNGAATEFPYTFKIPLSTDLRVYLTELATGIVTNLTTAQYSISGLGEPAGGAVTYPLSGSPLAAGNTLTIERVIPYTQTSAIPNQGAFYANTTEAVLDRLVMMMQQINAYHSRSVRAPTSDDPLDEMPVAELRANKTLGFDSEGQPIVGSVSTAIVSAAMVALVEAATIAAARTVLALDTKANVLASTGVLSADELNTLATVAAGGALSDLLPFIDASAANGSRKVLVSDFITNVISNSTDTTPADQTAYELIARKLSDGVLHKVLLSEVGKLPASSILYAAAVWNPPSINNTALGETTVTVTGAAVGDFVVAVSADGDAATTAGLWLTGQVTAANTVTIRLGNLTGGPFNAASQNFFVFVVKKAAVS